MVFVHMEKCGGSSVRRLLYEAGSRAGVRMHIPCHTAPCSENLSVLSAEKLARLKEAAPQLIADHSPYLFVSHHFDIPASAIWHFTLLREPISRLVSHFSYFEGGKAEGYEGASINEYPLDLLLNYARRFGWFYSAKLTQRYMHAADGRTCRVDIPMHEATAIARGVVEDGIDFIGFLDAPRRFVREINRHNPLGLRLDTLPHDRVGSYEPLQPSRRAALEEALEPDITLYEYARSIWLRDASTERGATRGDAGRTATPSR